VTPKPHIYQLPNGHWKHAKEYHAEYEDRDGAAMAYRFCCEWEEKCKLGDD